MTVLASEAFATLLRRHRVEAGLTQEQLAERAGLSERGIQNLERGVRLPYPNSLERIVRALELQGEERQRFREAGRRPPQARAGGATPGPGMVRRHNLPVPLTSLVGREHAVADVRRLMGEHRLVTLTGSGGMGKTRLAIEAAREMAATYDHGAWLVELASLADPALPAQAAATALGVQEQPGQPLLDTLAEALRATLDWSHDLLSSGQQALFRRLAAFAGDWSLEDAESVCSDAEAAGLDPSIDGAPILELLGSLVDKSLVDVAVGSGDGRSMDTGCRYRLLETMRWYAAERLQESGEGPELRGRHLAWYARLGERAERALLGPEQLPGLELLEREDANLRAALAWAARPESGRADVHAGLRLAGALWRFWFMRVRHSEARDRLADLLERAARLALSGETETADSGAARAKALRVAGSLAFFQKDLGATYALLEESLALSRILGDAAGAAYALNWLGWQALREGVHARTLAYFDESVTLARGLPDRYLTYEPTFGSGMAAKQRGDLDTARRCFRESIALCRAQGDRWYAALPLHRLGELELGAGNLEPAMSCVAESLATWRDFDDRYRAGRALATLGAVERRRGRYVAAQAYYQRALQLAAEVGSRLDGITPLLCLSAVAVDRDDALAAREYLRRSAALLDPSDYPEERAVWLEAAGGLASIEGRHERAARIVAAASALRRERQIPLVRTEREALDRWLGRVRRALGREAFARAWAEGETLSLAQVTADEIAGLEARLERPLATSPPGQSAALPRSEG